MNICFKFFFINFKLAIFSKTCRKPSFTTFNSIFYYPLSVKCKDTTSFNDFNVHEFSNEITDNKIVNLHYIIQ